VSGEFGGLSVDRRQTVAPTRSEPSPSAVAARADRAAPGEWDEGLEPYGGTPYELPGRGERGEGCGEWYPESVCSSCGEPHFSPHVCGARSCPDCWGVWAKEAGVRATTRIQAFRYTQPDDWRRQVAHATVSPPEGEVMSEREYWDGRSKAAGIAKAKGWRGFTVIPHPFRVTDEGKERYEEEDPEYGIWVWLRNDVEGMERYIYWSPHYHIVGATGADMEPARESDEWSYTFLRSVESFDGVRDESSHKDLYGLFRYILSHTGYPAGSSKQVVTWYGDLANSVFVEEAGAEWQHEKPSEGVLSALEREVESVAGLDADEPEEANIPEESDAVGRCEVDGCDGELIDVFDVRQYLRQVDPPPDVREAMEAAIEWRLGERLPPPGLKRPSTEKEAREAFGKIVG